MTERKESTHLYVLHGFLGLPSDWNLLSQTLPYSIKTIDLFNDFPIQSLSSWAEVFNQFVHAEDSKVFRILLGYSLGARLAMHALLQAPHLWNAAVIVSGHPGLEDLQEREQRIERDRQWSGRFENDSWEKLMEAWNDQKVFSSDAFHFNRYESDYQRRKLSEALQHWSLGRQKYLADRLENLNIPILWVAGSQDSDYAAYAQRQRFGNPKSLKWIADAGHRVPWQLPMEFLSQLTQFFNSIGAPS
jgi:2-succinyl-6-hydroxy-2,4-cyclohexadiene-1-carboxylate synthase